MENKGDNWEQHWRNFARQQVSNPGVNYRKELIVNLINLYNCSDTLNLVDFGSGPGNLLEFISNKFPSYNLLGIEYSQSGIDYAKKIVSKADFIKADLLSNHTPPKKYEAWADIAVCSEVLEHVDDPQKMLENFKPYLKKDCKLIVTVPGGFRSEFFKHIGHRRHFTKDLIKDILEKAGYEVKNVYSAGFPFYTLYQIACILRGKKLIEDAKPHGDLPTSKIADIAMSIFRPLMKFNFLNFPFGWQLVAVAKKK